MTVTGIYYAFESGVTHSKGWTRGLLSPFKCNAPALRFESVQCYTFNNNSNFNTYLGDNENYNTFILSNNVFLNGSYNDNYFGNSVQNNTFDDDMDGNIAGINFQNNINVIKINVQSATISTKAKPTFSSPKKNQDHKAFKTS